MATFREQAVDRPRQPGGVGNDPLAFKQQGSSDAAGVGALYASLVQETGAPVLEITCATGRFAIPIARQGFAE